MLEQLWKQGGDDGVHPMHKTGFCGFLGTKFQGRLAHGLDTKINLELALALAEEQERVQPTPM